MTENIIYVNKETLEIEAMRTENSKTFYVSDTERRLVSSQTPLHVKDKNGKWVDITCDIKNRKVTNCPYKAKLLKNKIGYQIDRGKGKIIEIELTNFSYKDPVIENNTAIWKNISPSIDLAITFTSSHVQFNLLLKNKRAKKTFEYRMVAKEKLFENVSFGGNDSNSKAIHLEMNEISTKNVKRKGYKLVEKIISSKFVPEVTEMDPKTRKRFWSKNIKYPVIIH